jgi:hypothetical protein
MIILRSAFPWHARRWAIHVGHRRGRMSILTETGALSLNLAHLVNVDAC